MVKDTDLAWLAGIIDGECGVSISKGKVYHAQIHLENTDERIVQHYCDLIEALGIRRRVITRIDNTSKRVGWKVSYVCSVDKFSDLQILLPAVMPFLIGKREQSEAILEWVKHRQSVGRPRDNKGRLLKSYSEIDENIYLIVKKLNNRGNIYGQIGL